MLLDFMLLKTEPGKEDEVLKTIRGLNGVREAHTITTGHNIIVEMIADDMTTMKEIVRNVRSQPHLTDAETYQCQEEVEEIPEKPIKDILAYVLLETRPVSEIEVANMVREVEGVLEAYPVYGVWDIFSEITAADRDSIREIIRKMVQKAGEGKIQNTLTMIVMDKDDKERKAS